MKIHVLTLFPEMIEGGVNTSILKKAIERDLLQVEAINIRDYSKDKHKKVDDYPYGGGAGMLMQAQPVYDAYMDVTKGRKPRTVYVTPQGTPFCQKIAEEMAEEEELVFLCGHYEGIDERVLEEVVTDYISIGDYVLTGGELPAMVMIDAIARLIPEVLHNDVSAETESFHRDLLEYPQYSRPEVWMGKKVPEVLLSGDHKKIMKWRTQESEKRTKDRRPDLYEKYLETESFIEKLKKQKRKYIHVIESLRSGRGQLLYKEETSFVVWEKCSRELYVEGEIPKALWEKTEIGDGLCLVFATGDNRDFLQDIKIVTTCETVAEQWLKAFGNLHCEHFKQALYTKKETLPVKYKDIKVEKSNDFPYIYVCYVEEKMAGSVGTGYLGRIDFTENRGEIVSKQKDNTAEDIPGKEVIASLEAYMINSSLTEDCVTYVRIPAEQIKLQELQEELGLIFYDQEIFQISR